MSKIVTINPKEELLNLEKKPVQLEGKDLLVGRALALVLISGTKSADPLRAYSLGRKLSESEEPIQLEVADVSFILEAMKGFQGFTTLVIGQLMEKLQ